MTRFRFWLAGETWRFYIAVFKYPYSPQQPYDSPDRHCKRWWRGPWLLEVGW